MDYLKEMYRFLERILRLNQEEIEIMNKPITNTEIKSVIKNLSKNKSPGPDGLTGEFYQTFREELVPIFLKLFTKIAEEETLPKLFYESTMTLILKPGKDTHKKENYMPVSLMNTDAKIFNKILQTVRVVLLFRSGFPLFLFLLGSVLEFFLRICTFPLGSPFY